MQTYSSRGFDYSVEKADTTQGWTFTIYEEEWNHGFWDEMRHFVDCVRTDGAPRVTGEDGRAVMEVLFAAYESARIGAKVELPFQSDAKLPISGNRIDPEASRSMSHARVRMAVDDHLK